MDTVTQITLGSAVGEAVLGKKLGNKAAAWGAAFGVLPDLDVLASPFVSEVQALAIHRGITHSLFFCVVAAPLFGWLLNRYTKKSEAGWKDWSLVVFLALLTHIIIDACTSYGTQIFQPFSNYSFSLHSVFIIDPFYTVPLAAGILTTLFLKRRWANYLGLAVSSLYLLVGLGIKMQVNSVFEQNFSEQKINPEKYITTPAPLSIFLWTGYAKEGDSLYAGLYSVFDDDRKIQFHTIPQNESLLESYSDQLPVERLIWFSQGFYVANKNSPNVIVHDLRFGRSDLWLGSDEAPFVWNYRLRFNGDSTKVIGFQQFEPRFDVSGEVWRKLIHRTLGKEDD